MSDLPPGVGPHEGRELDLLLSGDKPLAKFRLDGLHEEYEKRFEAAVARGDLVRFDFPHAEPHLHRRYYCRHGEEWRVKLLEWIASELVRGQAPNLTEDDLHRMDGTLLGYERDDIDAFIEHIHWRRSDS